MSQRLIYNLAALVTETFWGLTFVSTKVLISCGLSPTWIFIIRFAIAYLCVLIVCHGQFRSASRRDELYMAGMGLTGGSMYYIAENTALQWSYASNVSMIVCGATPLLTTLLCVAFYGERIGYKTVIGSALALAGLFMVIFNGSFNIGLNPAGDLLALLAGLLWAVYCLQLKRMGGRYPNLFITRKVFFYGCVTGLVWSLFEPAPQMPTADNVVPVVFNLLFLGIIASFMCYILWGKVVNVLGPDRAANYLYFNPLIAVIASVIILGEPITLWLITGGVLTVVGVGMMLGKITRS